MPRALRHLMAWASLAVSVSVTLPGLATPVRGCLPRVSGLLTVVTAASRRAAAARMQPPLADRTAGLAWPDTPMGIIRTRTGYSFFASGGGRFARPGGGFVRGTVVMTTGTLNDPLGTLPPRAVSIEDNPDPAVASSFASFAYLGGGPVFQMPAGQPGAGRLLMVTHGEVATPGTKPSVSFYATLGLAASADGHRWIYLGDIIKANQPYARDMQGFDIGDPSLVATPDGQYVMIYFQDWLAGMGPKAKSLTAMSVARTPLWLLATSVFGQHPHAPAFNKYDDQRWEQPGLGGRSEDLVKAGFFGNQRQAAFSDYTGKYVMIFGGGAKVGYAESVDGLVWDKPVLLRDFTAERHNIYVTPAGLGPDPQILGATFDVFYTWYPTDGGGWDAAELRRFTVTCG